MGQCRSALISGLFFLSASIVQGQDIPTLRIGQLSQPPVLDGQLDEQEWAQAARLTGFQEFGPRALAPAAMQPIWYLGYDQQYLYLAQYSPVYPKGTIKAHVKQGDNGGQNPLNDAILGDDHVEIQICDLPAREQAIKQYFYKIMTNPYGAVVDQRTEWSVGWMGTEWESKAKVAARSSDDGWTMEMAIPLQNLGHPDGLKDNTTWFIQLVSASDSGFFYNAWQPVLWTNWDFMPAVTFDSHTPVFHLLQTGELERGKLDVVAEISTPAGQPPVQMRVRVIDQQGRELFAQTQTAPAGDQPARLQFKPENLPLTDKRNKLEILVDQPGADDQNKIIYSAGLSFENRSDADMQRWYDTMATGRKGAGQPVINSCYYHSQAQLTASCDVDILKIDPAIRAATTFRTTLRHQDQDLLSAQATINPQGQGHVQVSTGKLADGDYQVISQILAADGQVLAERVDPFVVQSFPWEGNQLGMEKIVIAPFTPVQVDGMKLQVWGRTYDFAASGLPTSIQSKGQEMLASPIRLQGQVEGADVQLQADQARWTQVQDHNATLESQGRLGEHVKVDVQADTEYDGTTFYTLTVAPAQEKQVQVDQLELVIPLQKLTDWQAVRSSGRDVPYGNVPDHDGVFWDSSQLPAAAFIHGTFLPYCVISDGERGLSWAADSDQGWMLDDNKPSFFLERRDGQILMRARFVNTASVLKEARTIRFMLTAMPIKPLPAEHRYRAWGTVNAPFGWMNGFQGSGMWAYGAGPTVSFQTQEQLDILKERLEQDRRRVRVGAETVPGPKFLPMSAWYMATNTMGYAMPEYDTYCGEWVGLTTPRPTPQEDYVNFTNEWGQWTTPRQQSRAYADLVQSTIDCRVYSYDQQQKQAGMNGYWWDHSRFWTGGDLIKGSAYIRDDGQVQGIYNISLMRQMMKRMAVVAYNNHTIPFQGYYSHGEIGPVGGFMQWLWAIEGPWYLNSDKVSLLDNIRGGLDGIRPLLQTYQGAPVTMRNETQDRNKDDAWQTRSCLGVGLLFDVGVGVEGGAVDDKTRNELIEDLRKFDYFNDQVQWIPYWRTSALVQTGNPDVVATLYVRQLPDQTPGVMVVLFNKGDGPTSVSLSADGQKLIGTDDLTLHDLEDWNRDPMKKDDGRWNDIKIRRHDFRVMLLGPSASPGW